MTFLIHKRANNRNNRRVMSKIFNVNKFYLYSSSIHKLVVRSCYGRSHSVFPPVPSQGKNLNVLINDCAALPLGDRSPLGTFHVPFLFGKRLTVNVFSQRINQLFQGGGDIWRGIAQHSLRVIAFSVPPGSFSREKPERVDERLRSTHDGRLRSTPYGRSLSSRLISCSIPGW
ncbi:hypothetical protein [Cylindrospermopsis raciborskii]|uniref:hypothetical protein n=1 Tax=Cylindrospermopsis raciborskii TaxID=77022 RepID=UPI003DA5F07B